MRRVHGAPGFVHALDEPDLDARLRAAAGRLGGDRFSVRSSGAAEDLPAGLADHLKHLLALASS